MFLLCQDILLYKDTDYILTLATSLTDPFCLSCTATYLALSILHKILYPYEFIFIQVIIFSLNTMFLILNNKDFILMASYALFRSAERQYNLPLLLTYFSTHV